jgi:hypothetical protein
MGKPMLLARGGSLTPSISYNGLYLCLMNQEERNVTGPMATPNPYQRMIIVWASVAICLISGVLFAWIGLWYMIPFFAIFGAVSLWQLRLGT